MPRDWLTMWRKQLRKLGYTERDRFDVLFMFSTVEFTPFYASQLGGWNGMA